MSHVLSSQRDNQLIRKLIGMTCLTKHRCNSCFMISKLYILPEQYLIVRWVVPLVVNGRKEKRMLAEDNSCK